MSANQPAGVVLTSSLQIATDTALRGKCGKGLTRYVLDRLDAGDSFRVVSHALWADTGVHISHESLRKWATAWQADQLDGAA